MGRDGGFWPGAEIEVPREPVRVVPDLAKVFTSARPQAGDVLLAAANVRNRPAAEIQASIWIAGPQEGGTATRGARVRVLAVSFSACYFARQEAMRMQDKAETPRWMRGNYEPVREEATAFDLPVEGSIPPELCGLYARNGANPREGETAHWFLGDGMVHGVSIRDGKAELGFAVPDRDAVNHAVAEKPVTGYALA